MKSILFAVSIAFLQTTPRAQQAPPPGQKQTPATGVVNLTAKSANVTESGTPVRINLLRWSTDEERNSLVAAMNPAAPVTAADGRGGGGRGGRAGGGRGGRGGRGGAAQADNANQADDVAPDPA